EEDAEDAAGEADKERLPEREADPVADDDQTGQDEDDRRQRAGRRGHRLDDVVLEDRRALEQAEDRHRDHRRRDRRRERQADLEAEVDVGGGEDDGDERAEDEAARGELVGFLVHGPDVTRTQLPVEPQPPGPRAVSESSATSTTVARLTGAMTSWAMR